MRQVKRRIGRIAITVTLAAAGLISAQALHAQDTYPDHPIRLIVPFPPGGQTDNVRRQLNVKITPVLGQQLIIDNRTGAAGSIGSTETARAKPDGYTLLIATTSTHAINPSVMANAPYDPVKDFAPVSMLGTGPIALSVTPARAGADTETVDRRSESAPGLLLVRFSGVASINNLAGELFKMRAGNLEILHVPYKGAGPAMQDLIGGQIEIVCSTLSAALPHHRQGRVRTLAVMKEERSIGAPGHSDARGKGRAGRELPTPITSFSRRPARRRRVVDHLNGAIAKVMSDRMFVDALVKLGVDPVSDSGPDKAAATIRTELAKWRPIIQALGLGAEPRTRSASPR